MIRTYPARLVRSRRTRLVAAASAGVIAWSVASAAAALPTGGVVFDSTPGPVTTITPGAGTLTVDQGGDRVVIDWSTFNIAAGETVTFNQPDAGAIAFNRVDPSAFTTIDGTLAANGGVWLFSPGGLLFGANAQVNVGSFVGSTARLQDADATAALTANTITATDGGASGSGTLTVSNGAALTAGSGYMVLLGETIVQNGSVVSNTDAVWYGVAEGGTLTIATSNTGQSLENATVSNTTGSTPSFTQGATGVTTAGTWVGISTPSIAGWTTVLNLGGATTANGAKPGTQDGVVILTGADGVVDLTTGDTELNTTGTLNSTFGINIDVNAATLNGDIGSAGAVAFYLDASDDIVVNGDIYGTLIRLESTGGDLTIGATSDIEGGHSAAGPTVRLYAYNDLTIAAGASVVSLSDMIISVADAGGTLYVGGSVYAFGTGSNGTATFIYSQGDLEIAAGALVDSAEATLVGASGQTTISGTVDSTSGTTVFSSDLTVSSTGLVDSDGATELTSFAAAGTITIDGTVTSGTTTTVRAPNLNYDLTIGGTGLLGSTGAVDLYASGDLIVNVDVTAPAIDMTTANGSITVTSAVTGSIITLDSGDDILLSATADIDALSVALTGYGDTSISMTAAGDLTIVSGAQVDGRWDVYLETTGAASELDVNSVVHSGGLLSIDGSYNVTLGADADVNGFATALYSIEITAGNDLDIQAGALIDAYDNMSLTATNGDLTFAGTAYGDFIDIDAGDDLTVASTGLFDINQFHADAVGDIQIDGVIDAPTTLFITSTTGDVTIGATADLSSFSIGLVAQDQLTTVAGSHIDGDGGVGTLSFRAYGADGADAALELSGDIIGHNIQLVASAGSTVLGGTITASNDVNVYAQGGDFTTLTGSLIDNADGRLYVRSGGDMTLAGDVNAESVNLNGSGGSISQTGGTITVETTFDADAIGDFNTSAGAVITSAVDYDAGVSIYANGDLTLNGAIYGYDVFLDSEGLAPGGGQIEIGGSVTADNFLFIYAEQGDIHLAATADLYAGTATSYGSIYIGAEGSITTDAGSQIHTTAYDGYVSLYANDTTGIVDLSGDISSTRISLGSNFGDVDVILRDGSLTAAGDIYVSSSGDLTTAAGTTISAQGNVYLFGDTSADISGDITGDYVYLFTNGDFHQRAGTITVHDAGFYSYSFGDTFTADGALIQAAAVGGDNAIIYLNAGHDLYIAGDIDGSFFVNLNSEGVGGATLLEVSGSIYANDFIILYNDRGDIHLTATADLYVGTPNYFSDPGVFIEAEGSILTDAGSSIATATGDPTAYVHIYSNDVVGTVDLAGDISSSNVYLGTQFGDMDLIIRDGVITAERYLTLYSSGDMTVMDNASLTSAYAALRLYGPDGGLIRIDGDISTSETIAIYNYVGDVEIGATATLHANTDASPDNGGPLGYQTDTIEIRGENITAEAGSQILVGDLTDPYRGTVSIISDDLDYDLPTTVTLDGYIKAEGIDVSVVDGSIEIDGDIYTTGDLAFDVSGTFTVGTNGYIYNAGYFHVIAEDGIVFDGLAFSYGIELTTTAPGADITIGGDLYSAFDIDVNSAGDIALGAGGTLQTDFLYSAGGAINLTAEGTVSTGLGSRIIVGHVGATTGDVVITANGADGVTTSAIDLSGYIYANGLGLIAPNGSIHLAAGGIYLTDGLDIDAAFDFMMDAGAVIDTPGAVSISAEGDLVANGDIYAGGNVSFYKYASYDGDLTVGGLVHSDGYVSIVNAADGDVILGGDIIADADVAGSGAYIYVSSEGQVVGTGGSILVGSVGATSGDVTINAAGTDSVDYSAIDLNMDIDADGLYLNTGSGSIHLAGGTINLTNDFNVNAGASFLMDGGTQLNDDGSVNISANAQISVYGGISAGGDVYLHLADPGSNGDLAVGGYVSAGGAVRLVNDGSGDVVLGGTVIADVDVAGLDGYIYVSSEGQVVATGGGLLQVGSGPSNTTGDVTINANGADSVDYSAIDLNIDIIADGLNLNAANGSIHLAGGAIQLDSTLDLYSAYDIAIDAPVSIDTVYDVYIEALGSLIVDGDISGADIYLTAGVDLTVGGTLTGDYVTLTAGNDLTHSGDILANDGVSLTSTGGDVYVDGFIEGFAFSGTAILVSAEGDLTIAAGGDLEGYGDVVLQTTGPGGVLEVSGDVLGYNVYLNAQGGILVGATADIYAYDSLQLVSDGPTGTVADIQIDGIMDGNGVSIINRNIGDVTFGATADVASYYYYCDGCLVDPGAPSALLGADGDIYIYSAGSVITVAGSSIDATAGLGADKGLITIVSGATDGTYSAIDLSGDIISYNTVLTTLNGSIHLGDGTITATESFTATSAGDFTTSSGSVVDVTIAGGHGDLDIVAEGDILLGGTLDGYYIDITSNGTVGAGGSLIEISGQVYATDGIRIANLNGDINVTATGEIYAGVPYESLYNYIRLTTYDGVISTEAGSNIHTLQGYDGFVSLEANVAGGMGIDLAGDITSDFVYLDTPDAGTIQITGGTIDATYGIYIDSGGAVQITGGLLTAADIVDIRSNSDIENGDILLAGDISADEVSVVVYSGAIPADIQIDGIINAGDYLTVYNGLGAITLTSTAELHGNLNDNLTQVNPAISLTGDSVVTEIGSLIDTPGAAPGSQIVITSTALSGVGIDLAGDINGGDVEIRSAGYLGSGTADVIISGDINALGDLTVDSYGELTLTAGGSLTAGVLVGLSSRDQMLIAGNVYGRYLRAEIDNLTGVDGAAIRVEGNLYADRTIGLFNEVGDVEIGAGAQIIANLDGLPYQTYQTYDIEILGEDILTEAGSLITTGAAAGPRVGAVLIESTDAGGATTLVDLSGDIDTDLLQIDIDDGSLRIRDGQIDTIASLVLVADGYFTVDAPADIYSQGYFFSLAYGGTIINGDVTAESIQVQDFGGPEVVIGGALTALEDITIRTSGDLRINGGQLISDSDNATGPGEFTGIYLEADGQVSTSASSVIRVGPSGAPTGNVSISADGLDGGGYTAIDLSGDIEAQYLYLDATAGSIRLRDGDIVVTSSLYIDTARDFIMDAPATITSPGDVTVDAGYSLSIAGEITAGDDIYLTTDGTAGSALTMNGTLTADGRVLLLNYGGDIILGGAYITSDADATGGGDIFISAEGDVIAPGGGLITAGPSGGAPTDDVTIRADGVEHSGNSTIDLAIDISAQTLTLYTDAGSIDIAGGDIYVTEDLTIDVPRAFTMGSSATITGLGDVEISAGSTMVVDGDITAGGDILLELYRYGFSYFTPGPGDMVVNGAMSANGSVFLHNYIGGDIYLGATAALVADADNSVSGDMVEIIADEQVISAAGSTIQVGPSGAPTGNVAITANGGDNASYSAIDLSGDIEAQTLTIDAGAGSIHLADGVIDVTQDLTINSALDFLMDGPAAIYGDANVSITAARSLVADGDINADGDIIVRLQGANALDIDVDGLMAAGGDIDIANLGAGDLTLGANATLDAGVNITLAAYGAVMLDGVLDATSNFYADAGAGLTQASGGQVLAGGDAYLNSADNMVIDGQITVGGDIFADSDGRIDVGGELYADGSVQLRSAFGMAVDGSVTALTGDIYANAGGDLEISGDMGAGGGISLYANNTLAMSGDIDAGGGIRGEGMYIDQSAGSITAGGDIVLRSNYDMTIDGDLEAGVDVRLYVMGGDGAGDLNIDGSITANDDVIIYNYTYGDIHLGATASVNADANADGGIYVDLLIHSEDGHIITEAGSILHVGDVDTRTGFISISTYGTDQLSPFAAAIDLSGDIDAGSISISSDGSVQVRDGLIAADNDIEIYAADFFILEADGVISGSESPANAFPNADQGVVYFDYAAPPGVSIAAADVTIDGQITSGDAIAIAAYNVSGGEVTVGGADSASLGTGFTLSNDEFQNLDADTIIIFSGQGEPNGAGYDLHIADLTIDSANVGEVFFGTTENLLVEGAVSPVGAGVEVNFGFGLVITDPDFLQPGQILADFIPTNIYISGSLGSETSPFGSVTLIAEGDILMGSQAFIDAAIVDPEFDALEQSGDFDGAESGHIFVASDILQMASMGRILQQNTGVENEYAGLIIGEPQPGQELIFVPSVLEGETIGGSGGWLADFSAGPSRIELFGVITTSSGDITGFNAALVDNLLDPDILVGEYFINSCQFGTQDCAFRAEDVPPFQSPFPPVDVDPIFDQSTTFVATFPFAEPDDEEEEDKVQGEPVTGSGNEDLWTVKPLGVRP